MDGLVRPASNHVVCLYLLQATWWEPMPPVGRMPRQLQHSTGYGYDRTKGGVSRDADLLLMRVRS